MREKFIATGLLGLAVGSGVGCKDQYIEGTVVDLRIEEGSTHTELRVINLPVCPENLGQTVECPQIPFEATFSVWDAPDIILTLKEEDGQNREYYVWPRVKKKAVIGEPIKINSRYASEQDENNSETILNQKRLEQ